MTQPVQIIGSYLSPYVRKVLVFLHAKKIPYEIDPIVPFYGNDAFTEISPVRRIPVLIDEEQEETIAGGDRLTRRALRGREQDLFERCVARLSALTETREVFTASRSRRRPQIRV